MSLTILLDAVLKGTILLGALFAGAFLLRRAPAATRHLLWAAGLASLLVLPVVSRVLPSRLLLLPSVSETELGQPPITTQALTGESALLTSAINSYTPAPEGNAATRAARQPDPAVAAGALTTGDQPSLPNADQVEHARRPVDSDHGVAPNPELDARRNMALSSPFWPRAILLAWVAGMLAVLGRLALGAAVVRKVARGAALNDRSSRAQLALARRQLGIRRAMQVLVSRRAPVPFTTGLFRPLIVLPESARAWSGERRFAVILHELAHLRRVDILSHLVAQLACAVHWFNPLAWAAARRLRIESERACDDLVLQAGTRPSEYASHLLEIVHDTGRSWIPAAALPMAQRSDFEGRLLAILEPRARRQMLTTRAAWGIPLAVFGLVIPLAMLGPARARAASPPVPADQSALGDPVRPSPPSERVVQAKAPSQANAPSAEKLRHSAASPAPQHLVPPKGWSHTVPTSDWTSTDRATPQQGSESSGATEALMSALSDSDPAVRRAVVRSLGQRQDTAAVTALVRSLREDADRDVRKAAAWALGQMESARAVPALGEALQRDSDVEVRRMAVWALGQIESASAIDALATAMQDRDEEIRRKAAWALGQIDDPRAVPALGSALGDADAEVRSYAAWALGQIESASAVPALSNALQRDTSAAVRRKAAWALGQIEKADAIPALSAALNDQDLEVRRTAVWALGQIEDPGSVPALTKALQDADPEIRKRAAHALGQIQERSAVEPLSAALKDEDAGVRTDAAWALGQLEDARAAAGLTAALGDPETRVRRNAAWALGQIRLTQAPAALIGALKDQDAQVRRVAAHALSEIRDPSAVEGLAALMHDADAQARRTAVRALAEIRAPSAYEALVAALKDDDPEVRKLAAQALGDRKR